MLTVNLYDLSDETERRKVESLARAWAAEMIRQVRGSFGEVRTFGPADQIIVAQYDCEHWVIKSVRRASETGEKYYVHDAQIWAKAAKLLRTRYERLIARRIRAEQEESS